MTWYLRTLPDRKVERSDDLGSVRGRFRTMIAQTYLFLFGGVVPLYSQLLHGRGRNRARIPGRMHAMRPLSLRRQLVPHIVHPSPQRGGIPNLEFELRHSGMLCSICRASVRVLLYRHLRKTMAHRERQR